MKKGLMTLGLGAGLMFLLDPDKGPRRRALVRDKFVKIGNDVQETFAGIIRDLENRWYGVQAELESFITPEEVTDEQLVARVRSRLGRLVLHPRAIAVTAHEQVVTLSGPVLDEEFGKVVSGVSRVRGVKRVHNLLEAHSSADIPALQSAPSAGMAAQWTPTTRVLAGMAAGVADSSVRRSPFSESACSPAASRTGPSANSWRPDR